jgi:hypothetical protein
MSFGYDDECFKALKQKQEDLEKLRYKVQRCYSFIKDALKPSDIEYILDNFIENKIFHKMLIKDIRDERSFQQKSTLLLDNILQSDKIIILHFLELIKIMVPDVYQYITGQEGILDIRYYTSNLIFIFIVKQSQLYIETPIRSLRDTIKRIEKFRINKQRFQEIKQNLEIIERKLEILLIDFEIAFFFSPTRYSNFNSGIKCKRSKMVSQLFKTFT